MSVEVNLIHVDRLFHSQWTRNGMFKDRSTKAFWVNIVLASIRYAIELDNAKDRRS